MKTAFSTSSRMYPLQKEGKTMKKAKKISKQRKKKILILILVSN